MSLLLQSGGDSIRSASGREQYTTVDVPSGITTGDMLLVIASVRGEDAVQVSASVDVGWQVETVNPTGGTIVLAYTHVATSSIASELRGGQVTVDTGGDGRCTNVIVLRATGGDPRRLVEATQIATDKLLESGVLEVPSFDPEWRTDNAILFVTSSSWEQDAPAPRATATGSAPIRTETLMPEPEADGMLGLSTSLAHRRLTSADPTGVSTVSFDSAPPQAWAVGFLLRSENRLPVISLPESWSAEVGRPAAITATVTDPDMTPVSLAWSQTGGPETVEIGNVYARSFQFTPNVPGVYTFTLVATDVDGGRVMAETEVVAPTGVASPATVIESDGWVDQANSPISTVEIFGDSNDGTFARTGGLPVGNPLTLGLPPIYGGAAVTLTIRGAATNPSPPIRRTIELRQSDGVLIAERSYDLVTAMRSYVFTTTREETALISNRSSMRLTITDEVS